MSTISATDFENYMKEQAAMTFSYALEAVGRTPIGLYVTDGEESIYVVFEGGGVLQLNTEGDCCSTSWWADAVGVKQLLNAEITKIEEIDMGEAPDDGRTRQESDIIYGMRFTTTQGQCDLIFRNSSNGYYGGSCEPYWVEAFTASANLTPITEDWRA